MQPCCLSRAHEIEVADVVMSGYVVACCDGSVQRGGRACAVPVAGYVWAENRGRVDGVVIPSPLDAGYVGWDAGGVAVAVVPDVPGISR